MADHGHSSQPVLTGMAAHKATYEGFLLGSVFTTIVCFYICVALVAFRFVDNPLNLLVGFGGLIVGLVTSLIALRMGGKWMLPSVVLVLYALFVVSNSQMS